MEELIGFVIFLVLAAFSMVSKVREQRAEEERRAQRAREKAQEQIDLPEATRRTLYGESGPPVAQPRQAPPVTPPPPAAEAGPLEKLDSTGQRRAATEQVRNVPAQSTGGKTPPQRVAGAPPAAPRPAPRPVSLDDLWQQMQREVQRRMQPAPAAAPPAPVHQQAPAAPAAPRQAQQRPRQQRHKQKHVRPAAPAAQQRPRTAPASPAAAPQRRAPAPRPCGTALFTNLDDVRRAIMLREVLGPPRAMEPWP